MARSYGFVAKIGADTTGLEASLRNIDNASRTLNTELNQINRALRLDPENVTLAAQRLEVMGQQAEQARERLRLLEEQQEEMNRALADGRITGADYREYERAIESARHTIEAFTEAQREANEAASETTNGIMDSAEAASEASGEISGGADAYSILTTDIEEFIKANPKAAAAWDILKRGAKAAAVQFAATAAAAVAVSKAVLDVANKAAEAGDKIDKNSQRIGVSKAAYQEWDYVLSQNGGSIDTLTAGIARMTNLVDDAAKGNETAIDTFNRLGLSLETVARMGSEDRFEALIYSLQGIENESERNAIAADILGKSYTDIIPLLNSTAEATETLREKAHQTGQIMSDEAVAAAVAYTDAIDTMKRSLQGITNNLGAEFLPGMTQFVEGITDVVNGVEGGEQKISEGADKMLAALEAAAPKVQAIMGTIADTVTEAAPDILADFTSAIRANLPAVLTELGAMGKEMGGALLAGFFYADELSEYQVAGSMLEAERRLAEAEAELAAKQAAENGGIIAEGMSEGAEKVKAAGGELEEAVADSLEGVNAAADNGVDGLTTRAGLLSDALSELEHQYKTHNKTELEYQTERKALLERYADVSDEEWWEMYDDACEYFDNMREAEAEALQKEQEALKKAAEERQKAYDKQHEADVKAAEGRFDELIDELTEGEIAREEFNLRYIDLVEELAERQIDISAYAADKIAEYDEKIREENYKAWEKSAEEVTKAISSAYDDVTRSYEQARDKYISSASLIDEKITDSSGAERYILSDFKAQTKALREYQEDLKKLKETGISDELMEQVMGLSYDSGERQGYIDELLKMSDEQRKKYYRDIDAYLAAAEGAAEAEVSDKLSDADRLAREGIEKIYGSLPADAYEKGIATARSFIDGINSEMAAADELRLSAADVQSREAFTAARSELQSGANNQRGGNYYEGSTPINIYIDGKAAIKSTLDSLLRKNKLTGGNNLHV